MVDACSNVRTKLQLEYNMHFICAVSGSSIDYIRNREPAAQHVPVSIAYACSKLGIMLLGKFTQPRFMAQITACRYAETYTMFVLSSGLMASPIL